MLDNAVVEENASDDIWQTLNQQADYRFPSRWLTIICAQLDLVQSACLVLKKNSLFIPVAVWPDKSKPSASVISASGMAVEQQRDIILRQQDTSNSHPDQAGTLACLIKKENKVVGVISVDLSSLTEEELAFVKGQFLWGSAWLFSHIKEEKALTLSSITNLDNVFSTMTLCFEDMRFCELVTAVVSKWAVDQSLDCVSIGFREARTTKLIAVSHNATFDKRSNYAKKITFAMDEAIDQREIITFPCDDDRWITRAHSELLEESGNGSVVCIPLTQRYGGTGREYVGAVCIEHGNRDFFAKDTIELNQQIAMIVGPLLENRRQQDRWIGVRLVKESITGIKYILGDRFYASKFILALVGILIVLASLLKMDHVVSSNATLEGWTQRHMTASMDGYVYSSELKPGDVVKKGELLFMLDNRDLKLEFLKWENKLSQVEKQHLEALSLRKFAEAGVLLSQVAQAQAQIDLISEQLKRTEVLAPFDGVIVTGDLSQKIGAPVKRGETLMQIAPLKDYRIILNVDERDIAFINNGQQGLLKLSSLSNQHYPFELLSVEPVGSVNDGVNSFKVEAMLLSGDTERLRPGMQGKGKVNVGEKRMIWIFTHRFVDWFKVWSWSWWPL